MALPPGPNYLIRRAHYVAAPPAFVYALSRVISTFYNVATPVWLLILASVLAYPIAFTISVQYTRYVDEREAAKYGAVLPPRIPDNSIGGTKTLGRQLSQFKKGYIGEVMDQTCGELGNTINMRVFFENRILTTEPEYIKMILATQFNDFEKGKLFATHTDSLLGTGVFNADGEMWKFHRSMTRPFFSKERIGHFDIFESHADDAIQQTKDRINAGYAVDFQDMVSRFTLDSATEFLFGNDVRSLSAGLPYPHNTSLAATYPHSHPANVFAQAFLEAQELTALRSRYGSAWPLKEFWKDEVRARRDVVNQFIDPILKDAIAKKQAEKQTGLKSAEREVNEGETLLDHLVNYTEDATVLKDETMNIMIAGRDTTAGTLTFVVYLLAEHPDVMVRLREEILSKVGPSMRPSYDDLRDMKYLRAVINETMRLFPAVPFNLRMTKDAAIWPSKTGERPFYIPPRTRTPYSVFLMHRRKDLWGPDALEFDPDRFLDDRVHKYLTPNPFIFLPFNAGPRICLGQQFAYNEMSFFLVRFLQNFSSVSLAPNAQPLDTLPPPEWSGAPGRKGVEKIFPRSHLTIYASGGLWVDLQEANHVEAV